MQKIKLPTVAQLAAAVNEHKIAVTVKFLAITSIVVAFYAQDLKMIFTGALTDEATFHILAAPFLFAYLIYRKRKMISAAFQHSPGSSKVFLRHFGTIIGALLTITVILVYWYGSYTFTPLEYHIVTLPFLVTGLTLILFNIQVFKQMIFPIAFLFFLTPPPAEFLYSVGSVLSNLSASVSNGAANVFGLHTILSNTYGSPMIQLTRPDQTVMNFSVDVACSGIYSIIGFTIFALFIAYITRGHKIKKFAIFALGIPLIMLLNIIRITTILFIGYYYGDELALQVFHAVGATVLMFIGTLILLLITEKIFKKTKQPETCSQCQSSTRNLEETICGNCGRLLKYPRTQLNRKDISRIVVLAVIFGLFLSIQAPVFALTKGPAEVIFQTPSGPQVDTTVYPLPDIPGYTLSYIYRDTEFEKLSGEDVSLVYAYSSPTASMPTVWVAVEIAASTIPLHRWETCLVNYPLSQGQQLSVNQLDLRDVQAQVNPPIFARYFAFQYRNTNQTQVVLYWYTTATFTQNGTSEQKAVKMSLITYPQSPANVTQAEDQLLPIAQSIITYWQPLRTWMIITLLFSENGILFSAVSAALLAVAVFYAAFLQNNSNRSIFRLYGKLPEHERQMVEAVKNAKALGKATTSTVVTEYQRISGKIFTDGVADKLEQAERSGLVEQTLVNVYDEPTLVWNTKLDRKKSFLSRLGLWFR